MKNSMPRNRKANCKMDYFDQLPDELLLHIVDRVSDDINALFRLRTLSHRFNSLVIDKTKHLFPQVDKFDRIFGMNLRSDSSKPIIDLANQKVFLRCFNHVTKLVIELPALCANHMDRPPKPDKLMYKATLGKNLKHSLVILYYSPKGYCERDMGTRPFFLKRMLLDLMRRLLKKCASIAMNLVPHLENLASLVVRDSKRDIEMVMDMGETSEAYKDARVLRHIYRIRSSGDEYIDIGGGLGQGAMFLGVMALTGPGYKKIDDAEEADLIRTAFGSGVHGMAIEKLLHN